MPIKLVAVAAALVSVVTASCADAAVLRSTVVGCASAADATKIEAFASKHDKAGLDAFTKTATASRACISFAKGITVDIDENRAPLTCIRLTGDLSCYWISAAALDEYPSDKGGAAGGHKGGHRH